MRLKMKKTRGPRTSKNNKQEDKNFRKWGKRLNVSKNNKKEDWKLKNQTIKRAKIKEWAISKRTKNFIIK